MPGRTACGAGRLRGAHHVEDAGQLALGVGVDTEGAGHVGAVALEGGTEVDHHRVARGDATAAGVMVRLGRVLPRRHDGVEGRALGAAAAHGRIELEGEVLLGHALAHEGQHLEEGGVGDGGGPLHAGDLGRILALAQRLDRVGGGDQVVGVDQVGPDALAAPGDVVGLEPDAGVDGQHVLGRLALGGDRADLDVDLVRRARALRAARPTGCGSGRRW